MIDDVGTLLLREFLREQDAQTDRGITPITPDASVRRYYRVPWQNGSAVVALYPEPFDPANQPFLDVSEVFAAARLPIPRVLAIDPTRGIIVQEDLGDRQLRDALGGATGEERARLLDDAISIIVRIQEATAIAIARDSIASRLAFDEEKLIWELNYFAQHYFVSLRGRPIPDEENLRSELSQIARELAARPRVLCHRDFHSANIIVDPDGNLRVIDYQDARMGPLTYDLVSLVLDRCYQPPADTEVDARREAFLLERRRIGLHAIDREEFLAEFHLMSVQRCLKAAGTFSYQTAVNNRGAFYGEFIRPMLQITLAAAERLDRFPVLRRALVAELAG